MTLKQLTDSDRINFLKKFTAELVINIVKKEEKEKTIRIEKIKQKFIEPKPLPEQTFKKIIHTPIFERSRGFTERKEFQEQKIKQIQELEEKKKMQKLENLEKEPVTSKKELSLMEKLRKPIFHRVKTPQIKQAPKLQLPPTKPIEPRLKPSKPIKPRPRKAIRPSAKDITKIRPEAEPRPPGFALGKIDQFLKDITVQSIECAGPEKKILVKKQNKINTTPVSLTQAEITDIINSFSQQARIPPLGGILKAAVGDLVISAVISEYVGSRFIINKITPFSILR